MGKLKFKDGYQDFGAYPLLKDVVDRGDLYAEGGSSYKVYIALLSQGGEDAPIATILENTLDGIPVWTRNNYGDYNVTLPGAFPSGKTFCSAILGPYCALATVIFGRYDDDNCALKTILTVGLNTFGDFFNAPEKDACVEIRVYN